MEHYEEGEFNGVLCWRKTKFGKWTEFTKEELARRIRELEGRCLPL